MECLYLSHTKMIHSTFENAEWKLFQTNGGRQRETGHFFSSIKFANKIMKYELVRCSI